MTSGFYFLDTVEGELAVAGFLVNLFKDRGVDLCPCGRPAGIHL